MVAGLVIFGLMTFLWLVSVRIKDASIVDPFWGAGFVVVNWVYFVCTPDGFVWRKWIISILLTIWGLRLALYLLRRNMGKGEDYRYQKWRQDAGVSWWYKSYFKVFLLQGLLMWLISTPLLAAQYSPTPAALTFFDFFAVAVWTVGFFFEAVGDWQLARFKANPANQGKLLTSGLWRFTRHPNYFGDAVQWWAYYLLALAAGGWFTIFSPLIMTLLLRYVSGVSLLEKALVNTKPGYAQYVAATNAFWPWFPKKPL